MIERGSTVMMQAWAEYSALFIELARRLKRERNCRIHLYVSIDRDVEHYSGIDGGELFASVTHASSAMEHCFETLPPRETIEVEARANEKCLGVTYNSLALANRHLGRGFALGGFHFPRSRLSENANYAAMLHGFNREIAFWRREVESKKPSLMIGGGKICATVVRHMGVTQRWLGLSRYKNYHFWAMNELYESPAFERAYRGIRTAQAVEIEAPYKGHMDLRETFVIQTGFARTLLRAGYMLAQRTSWKLRGLQKGRNYYMRDEIAYVFRRRRQMLATTGRHGASLNVLAGRRFIYFPLHVEPEAALQGISPEYFYQLSCIAALARDLPAGVLLAVKDTYASMGVRPDNFYDQIRAFKNVVLLDTMTFGLEVIRKAELVATITGTAGMEAAVMGKPVLSFGHHNIYNFLPHVRLIKDESELKPALDEMLDEKFDRVAAKQAGSRFITAIVQESFDLGSFDLRRRHNIEPEACERAWQALQASLASQAVPISLEKAAV